MSISLVTSSTAADFTGTSGSHTVPSTTAGNLAVVVIQNRSNNTTRITSITDGGDTFVSAGALGTLSVGGTRDTEIWYCLSVGAGKTSFTINMGTSVTVSARCLFFSSTLGTMVFGSGGGVNDGIVGVSTGSGPSLSPSGLSNLLVNFICSPSASFTAPGSGWTNLGDDGHGNPIDYRLNVAAGTFADAVPATNPGDTFEASGAWWSEPTVATFNPGWASRATSGVLGTGMF